MTLEALDSVSCAAPLVEALRRAVESANQNARINLGGGPLNTITTVRVVLHALQP